MARSRRAGLGVRGQLVFLVCAVVAPFLLLASLRARERGLLARTAVEQRALSTALLVRSRVEDRAHAIHALLSATTSAVRLSDDAVAANDSVLLAIMNDMGDADAVTNLWVHRIDGVNIGTSRRPLPARPSVFAGDRPYFREAVRTARPTVGDPMRTRSDTSRWTVTFAQPVIDPRGALRGMVLGTIALRSFERTFAQTTLPSDAVVTLTNARRHRRRALARRGALDRPPAGTVGRRRPRARRGGRRGDARRGRRAPTRRVLQHPRAGMARRRVGPQPVGARGRRDRAAARRLAPARDAAADARAGRGGVAPVGAVAGVARRRCAGALRRQGAGRRGQCRARRAGHPEPRVPGDGRDDRGAHGGAPPQRGALPPAVRRVAAADLSRRSVDVPLHRGQRRDGRAVRLLARGARRADAARHPPARGSAALPLRRAHARQGAGYQRPRQRRPVAPSAARRHDARRRDLHVDHRLRGPPRAPVGRRRRHHAPTRPRRR